MKKYLYLCLLFSNLAFASNKFVSDQCLAAMALAYTEVISANSPQEQEDVVKVGLCVAKKVASNFQSSKCECKDSKKSSIKKCIDKVLKEASAAAGVEFTEDDFVGGMRMSCEKNPR